MKKLTLLLLILGFIAACSQQLHYTTEEYKVRSDESLDQIIKSHFPSRFSEDKEENENLKTMLKMYNKHLPSFPEVQEGDIMYLTRPLSPFIPAE